MTKSSILIIDDDVNYTKEFASYVQIFDKRFEVCSASNGIEGLEAVEILRPDVIILDLYMPILDGIGFLRRFSKLEIEKRPVIIVSSESKINSMCETAAKYKADYIMIKPQPYSEICSTIIDLTSRDKNSERIKELTKPEKREEKAVVSFMRLLGIPAHLTGYRYIKSTLITAIRDISIFSSITKKLYPKIAEEYSTTPSCVERAIRHAVSVSWERGNKKLINDIFNYTSLDAGVQRPTNAEYLAMVADELRMRMRYDTK